ncbi:MAG: transporter [Thermoleophilia bacterium]|nr:transporter [Thermoleophilia bacterium]
MTDYAIQLDHLTKRFGSRVAVDDVTLAVPAGSVYGLVGPNGAGKTTLMRTLLGFTRATSGQATVLGAAMPKSHRMVYPRVGVIIEEPRFFPFLTGRRNLRQIAAARPEHISEADIDRALATVDLADRADDRVKTYSLGMRQRLGIARAMLHDPELLILDEPSNGLDPPGIRDMRLLLRRVAAEGRTVLVSSHLLGEMELLCDHVAVLKDGALIANGPIDELRGGSGTAQTGAAHQALQLLIGATDVEAAERVLANRPGIASSTRGERGNTIVVTFEANLGDDAELRRRTALLTASLATAGAGLFLVQPVEHSLEERFLNIVGDGGGLAEGDS